MSTLESVAQTKPVDNEQKFDQYLRATSRLREVAVLSGECYVVANAGHTRAVKPTVHIELQVLGRGIYALIVDGILRNIYQTHLPHVLADISGALYTLEPTNKDSYILKFPYTENIKYAKYSVVIR